MEYTIGYIFTGSLLGLVLGSLLYWLGGRDEKWQRRFVASLIIASTVNIASYLMKNWHWWFGFAYPLLIGGFSLGYGADNFLKKIVRRSIYALANVSVGLLFVFTLGAWDIFILHLGVGIWSIYLGVKNPVYAPVEEGWFVYC